MSGYTDIIKGKIEQMPYNELFFASEWKRQNLSDVPDAIYYKVLERLTKAEQLVHLTKGLYYRPLVEDGHLVPISDTDIVDYYVADSNGMQIGEGLLIEKGIALGARTRIDLLSKRLMEDKKRISAVSVEKIDYTIDSDMELTIETLEILQNYNKAKEINRERFVAYMRQAVQGYSDETVQRVLKNRKYKKSTIAFYKRMLDWFEISNELDSYLSTLSQYKIPTIDELRLELPTDIKKHLQKYVTEIKKIYGQNLREVILYGSYAKGNYDREESDVDIMILVEQSEEELQGHRRELSESTYDFNETYHIDIKPIAKSRYEFLKWEEEYPFYKNIREEGIQLYGVA